MIKQTVYNNTDNTVDVVLKKDGEAQDLSAVTQILLIDDNAAFSLDSDTDTDVFDWTDLDYTGQVMMVLGGEGIAEGVYIARLITIDPTFTNGLCWGEMQLTVITP